MPFPAQRTTFTLLNITDLCISLKWWDNYTIIIKLNEITWNIHPFKILKVRSENTIKYRLLSFLCHYRPSTKRCRTIDKNKNLNYHLCFRDKWWQNFILEDCGAPPLSRGPGSLPPVPLSTALNKRAVNYFLYFSFLCRPIWRNANVSVFPPCPDSRLGNGVPPTKYLGERRYPAFPPLHHVM